MSRGGQSEIVLPFILFSHSSLTSAMALSTGVSAQSAENGHQNSCASPHLLAMLATHLQLLDLPSGCHSQTRALPLFAIARFGRCSEHNLLLSLALGTLLPGQHPAAASFESTPSEYRSELAMSRLQRKRGYCEKQTQQPGSSSSSRS